MKLPRHPHARVVDRSLLKRLSNMGYDIVPKESTDPQAPEAARSDAESVADAEAALLTEQDITNAVEVAKGSAGRFASYFDDAHGRGVVEAVARFLILGEVPAGTDLASAGASAETGRHPAA